MTMLLQCLGFNTFQNSINLTHDMFTAQPQPSGCSVPATWVWIFTTLGVFTSLSLAETHPSSGELPLRPAQVETLDSATRDIFPSLYSSDSGSGDLGSHPQHSPKQVQLSKRYVCGMQLLTSYPLCILQRGAEHFFLFLVTHSSLVFCQLINICWIPVHGVFLQMPRIFLRLIQKALPNDKMVIRK